MASLDTPPLEPRLEHRRLQTLGSSTQLFIVLGIVVGVVVVVFSVSYAAYYFISVRKGGQRQRRDTLTARLQAVRVEGAADGAPRAENLAAKLVVSGLPATLPPSVTNLFRQPTDVVGDPEALEREREFYNEDAVDRATRLIHKYVVREESSLLIQATWRLMILQKKAGRLRAVSAEAEREAKEAVVELSSRWEESVRESGRDSAVTLSGDGGSPARAMSWFEKQAASSVEEASRAADAANKVLGAAGAAKAAAASSQQLGERGRGVSGALAALTGDSTPSAETLLAALPSSYRNRAKSMGPAGLDLDELEARAKRKADEAKRAKTLAQAALVAAENARRRAEERLLEARNRRELKQQPGGAGDAHRGSPPGKGTLETASSELGALVGSSSDDAEGMQAAPSGGCQRPGSSLCGCGGSRGSGASGSARLSHASPRQPASIAEDGGGAAVPVRRVSGHV